MSFKEPNNPRSREIINNQILLTELATYEERTPGKHYIGTIFAASKHFLKKNSPSFSPNLLSRLPP